MKGGGGAADADDGDECEGTGTGTPDTLRNMVNLASILKY